MVVPYPHELAGIGEGQDTFHLAPSRSRRESSISLLSAASTRPCEHEMTSVNFVRPQNYQSPSPSSQVPSEVSPNGSIDYLPVHGANSPTATSIIEDAEFEYENGYEPEPVWEDVALRRYIADPSRHERLALGVALSLAAEGEVGEQIAPTSMPIHSTEQGTGSSISLSPPPNAEDEGDFENDNDIMSEVARERFEARRRRTQIDHKPRSLKEPRMRKRSAGSSRGEKQKVARTK